ncbi:MAG: DUF2793 domain-containing protein [Pseudomonadota bacterium]
MAQPLTFPSTTAHFALPLLFAGQAQKEMTLNQAIAMVDALLRGSTAGSSNSPPADPAEGAIYRITPTASDAWLGKEDHLAIFIADTWQFVAPLAGMRLYDIADGKLMLFDTEWKSADDLAVPQGGSVIDIEARSLLADLIEQLKKVGIFSNLS